MAWKWLDVRALVDGVVQTEWAGLNPRIDHVTYCTAKVFGGGPDFARQAAYVRALTLSGTVDWVEYGLFKERFRKAHQATEHPTKPGRPVLLNGNGLPKVGVSLREEKGSDVNLASHLLIDTLTQLMDAAVGVSNDTDLKLPVREARARLPVGVVSPSRFVHNDLKPGASDGPQHWVRALKGADFLAAQLPDPCAGIARPPQWR